MVITLVDNRFDPVNELRKQRALQTAEKLITHFECNKSDYSGNLAQSYHKLTSIKSSIDEIIEASEQCLADPICERMLIPKLQTVREYKKNIEEVIKQKEAGRCRIETLELYVSTPKYQMNSEIKKERNTLTQKEPAYVPAVTDILDYFSDLGQVGDISVKILATLAIANRLCFGIEGLSGAGKTSTLDKVLDLFPKDETYVVSLASDKALGYAPDLNSKKIMVFSELQKAASQKTIEEILKDLGEGKSPRRAITGRDRVSVEYQTIENGGTNKKSVVYTKALENGYEKDTELSRRYFVLQTDVSKAQTREVISEIAKRQFSYSTEEKLSAPKLSQLKEHLKECLDDQTTQYADPFAEAIAEMMPDSVMTRSFCQHYFNLINASAKFHNNQRKRDTVFVTIQDVYIIHTLYHKQFEQSVLKLPQYSEEIIDALGIGNSYTSEQANCKVQEANLEFPNEYVKNTLEQLSAAGYVEKKNKRYTVQKQVTQPEIDWKHIWEEGVKNMQSKYPEVVDKWMDSQTDNGQVNVINPQDRTTVRLV